MDLEDSPCGYIFVAWVGELVEEGSYEDPVGHCNNRKHLFEVRTRRQMLVFPYARQIRLRRIRRVTEVFVDPELDREGFTYRLGSGEEGPSTSMLYSNTTKTLRIWPS